MVLTWKHVHVYGGFHILSVHKDYQRSLHASMHLPMLMHEASCTQGARLLCTRAAVLVLSVMLCGDGPKEGARPCNPHAAYHNMTLPGPQAYCYTGVQ